MRLNLGIVLFIFFPFILLLLEEIRVSSKETVISNKSLFVVSTISLVLFYWASMYHYSRNYIDKHIEIDRIHCTPKIYKWLYKKGEDEENIEDMYRNFKTLNIILIDKEYNKYIFDKNCEFIGMTMTSYKDR